MASTLMEWVYLLQEIDRDGISPTGLYKIGKTKRDVESRKRQYQAGNVRRVDTLHTIQVRNAQVVETKLHNHLDKWRTNEEGGGDEWFEFKSEAIVNYVIAVMDQYDETPDQALDYPGEISSNSYFPYSEDGSGILAAIGIGAGLLMSLGLVFAGFVTLPQPSQATSARIEVPAQTGYDAANLRSTPEYGNNIVDQVRPGEQLTAYEVSPDGQWRRVKLSDGRSGWVASNLVK